MENILTRGFWGDEAWTTLISALPWWDLVKTTAADFHPPLYYTVIHFWIQLFGTGEVTVRIVSIIFWLLSGVAAWLLARALRLPTKWPLLAAIFILFNPFVFQFAFEARNYTQFVFLSLASMWLFVKKSPWYILPTTLGLYTHYYMFFLLIAQYLFILLFRRDLFKKFFFFGVALVILYLPWLPFFLSQTKSVAGGYWIGAVHWDTIAGAILVLFVGEKITIFSFALPFVYLFYIIASLRVARKTQEPNQESRMFLLWLVVPFVIPIFISLVRPIFFYRYLIFLAAPVMLWPLFLLSRLKVPGKSLWLAVMLLAIYLYTDGANFVESTDQHFKPILAKIHAEAQPGDVIYTVLPSFAEVVYYNNYDGRPLPVKVLPVGLSQASGKALLDTYVAKNYLSLAPAPDNRQGEI